METVSELIRGFVDTFSTTSSSNREYDDPFKDMEQGMRTQRRSQQRFMERRLEDVVRSVQMVAENNAMNGFPAKRHFLANTFISFYFCEFEEKEPHEVRWIPRHSTLAEYIHHSGRGNACVDIGIHSRAYGSIGQYSETAVQTAIEELRDLCGVYGLTVASNWDEEQETEETRKIGDSFNFSRLKLSDDEDNSNNNNNNNNELTNKEKNEMEEDDDSEEGGFYTKQQPHHLKIVQNEQELAEQIFDEAIFLMNPSKHIPNRKDLFYNMIWSHAPTPRNSCNENQKIWWIFEKHAYSRLLVRYVPYAQIQTKYGVCCIYTDDVMEDIVDTAAHLCATYDLLIGNDARIVKPDEINGLYDYFSSFFFLRGKKIKHI